MMRNQLIALLMTLFAVTFSAVTPAVERGDERQTLFFDVYLDDSRIGYHRYDFQTQQDGRRVISEANFDVKFLFFTAFRYRHRNAEQWSNNCLAEIDAETDSNGKRTVVSGMRTESGFLIERGDDALELPRCVKTFAYWNPSFLDEPKLLNPQTGEFLAVDVKQLEPTQLDIGGREVMARPYKLTAKNVELTIWYSTDDEWLALESVAKGGRILRYERA